MKDLWTALCLVLVIEGLAYALAPGAMRRTMALVATMPDASLRRLGVAAMVLGVGGVWLLRSALITP